MGRRVPSFLKKLLLVSFGGSGRLQLCHCPFARVAPIGGRQRGPAYTTRNEIIAALPHHMEKGFVGLDNATFKVPNKNSNDVGIDQSPDLRLTFLEIAVETRVLQRDCRLRRQQLQDRDSIRSERVRGQRVLEVEQPRQPPLFYQWEAEN